MTYQATRPINFGQSANRQNGFVSGAPHRENVGYQGRAMSTDGNRVNRNNMSAAARAEIRRRREAEYREATRREAEEARRLEMLLRRREEQLARMKEREARARAEMRAFEKSRAKAARAKAKAEARRAEAELRGREIAVEKVKLPFWFIFGVVMSFVLLMGVVFSFSSVTESNAKLSSLKSEIASVENESGKLRLALAEKNDLNVIEQLATHEYNMVKEGSVQRKYISVSSGDRIVLEDTETEGGESFFGAMLSSASSAFDGILDYFR